VTGPLRPEAKLGRNVAEQRCSQCHAIGLADASPVAKAPPLRDLYKRYPIEDLRGAFIRGIEVAHPRMPVFRLPPQDIDNLLAYLRSIDPCSQPSTNQEAMARCFEPL
jgi:mono/diheme cytochrome c family protein